jgi:GT2 family glycosyltransferase
MRAMTTRNPPSLAVSVVLHHSPLPRLRQTLASLWVALGEAREARELGPARLWLIDNSEDDAYTARVRALVEEVFADKADWLQVEAVVLETNRGFGAGHNRALLDDDSDYRLVLNPDVVMTHDALVEGLHLLQRESGAVALSPRSSTPGGAREYLCKRYPSVLVLAARGFSRGWLRRRLAPRIAHYEMRDLCRGEAPVDVPLISGCFMLLRGAAVRQVRGFDTGYFMYFEDFDLSLRLRIHGRLLYVPAVRIVHYGGDAAGKGRRHIAWFLRSALRFFRQHGWRWI